MISSDHPPYHTCLLQANTHRATRSASSHRTTATHRASATHRAAETKANDQYGFTSEFMNCRINQSLLFLLIESSPRGSMSIAKSSETGSSTTSLEPFKQKVWQNKCKSVTNFNKRRAMNLEFFMTQYWRLSFVAHFSAVEMASLYQYWSSLA